MPWTYHQSTGLLEHDGQPVAATGYSGAPGSVNDPDQEAVHNMGPIPRGSYHLGGLEANHGHLGPNVLHLTPVGHYAHGRSRLYIHGDNREQNRSASEGCIILPPDVRLRIASSHDQTLEVVR
jgi:hypothetical protein